MRKSIYWAVLCVAIAPLLPGQGEQRARGADPVVRIDSYSDDSDHLSREKRKQRNKKHNAGVGQPLREPKQNEAYDGVISESHASLPSIPVSQSDVVLVGVVKSAKAYLSEDRDSVYSEFRVNPSEILKASPAGSVTVDESVDIERPGGAVQFPSGKVLHFRDFGEGLPDSGKRYVFFLKALPETEDYLLLTAYELRDRRVVPLDDFEDGETKTQFSQYRNFAEQEFLNLVRHTIDGGASK